MSKKQSFWIILFGALVTSSLTLSLGFWQLRRAALKEDLQLQMTERQKQPPLQNIDLKTVNSLAQWLHRPIELTGQWVPGSTIYLDNRQMAGRTGFYVVSPFKLEEDGRVMLIQRGWIPRDFMDRTNVPDVATPNGIVTVSGRLAAAPSKVYELGKAEPGRIRQNLDVDALAQEWSVNLIHASVVQTHQANGAPDDGLLRQWPQVASDVSKHHGYAFQWFGLSALILCLYVWFQIISPRRKSADSNA